jgi:putative endonuclease
LKLLVYAEHHDEILRAIQREKTLKHWSRAWKEDLITKVNPGWEDLTIVDAFGN